MARTATTWHLGWPESSIEHLNEFGIDLSAQDKRFLVKQAERFAEMDRRHEVCAEDIERAYISLR